MADELAAFWDFVKHGGDPWEIYSIEQHFLGEPINAAAALAEVSA